MGHFCDQECGDNLFNLSQNKRVYERYKVVLENTLASRDMTSIYSIEEKNKNPVQPVQQNAASIQFEEYAGFGQYLYHIGNGVRAVPIALHFACELCQGSQLRPGLFNSPEGGFMRYF